MLAMQCSQVCSVHSRISARRLQQCLPHAAQGVLGGRVTAVHGEACHSEKGSFDRCTSMMHWSRTRLDVC